MSNKDQVIQLIEQSYINNEISKRQYIPTIQALENAEDGQGILYYIATAYNAYKSSQQKEV